LGEKKDGWKIGKQHRTDDKTSPKVYYCTTTVFPIGLLHLWVSTRVSILVATSLTHPGIRFSTNGSQAKPLLHLPIFIQFLDSWKSRFL
jgi:hypothetical protein